MLYKNVKKPHHEQGHIIALGGYSGSGKTTLSVTLKAWFESDAARNNPRYAKNGIGLKDILVLNSDIIRKNLFHINPYQRAPSHAYSEAAHALTYSEMQAKAFAHAKRGGIVIVDATHLDPASRVTIEAMAMKASAKFTGLWLQAPRDVLLDRLKRRIYEEGNVSDAIPQTLMLQLQFDPGPIEWHIVNSNDTNGAIVSETIQTILDDDPFTPVIPGDSFKREGSLQDSLLS